MPSSSGETGRDMACGAQSNGWQRNKEVSSLRSRLAAGIQSASSHGHRRSVDQQGLYSTVSGAGDPCGNKGIDRARSNQNSGPTALGQETRLGFCEDPISSTRRIAGSLRRVGAGTP